MFTQSNKERALIKGVLPACCGGTLFIWLVGLIQQPVTTDFGLMRLAIGLNWGFIGLMYLYNTIMILANSVRINKGKKVRYLPKFTFIN